jgi:hypothetical protein
VPLTILQRTTRTASIGPYENWHRIWQASGGTPADLFELRVIRIVALHSTGVRDAGGIDALRGRYGNPWPPLGAVNSNQVRRVTFEDVANADFRIPEWDGQTGALAMRNAATQRFFEYTNNSPPGTVLLSANDFKKQYYRQTVLAFRDSMKREWADKIQKGTVPVPAPAPVQTRDLRVVLDNISADSLRRAADLAEKEAKKKADAQAALNRPGPSGWKPPPVQSSGPAAGSAGLTAAPSTRPGPASRTSPRPGSAAGSAGHAAGPSTRPAPASRKRGPRFVLFDGVDAGPLFFTPTAADLLLRAEGKKTVNLISANGEYQTFEKVGGLILDCEDDPHADFARSWAEVRAKLANPAVRGAAP